jgi:hypothetical protein
MSDWCQKVWMWDWHTLQLTGYPNWEIEPNTHRPAFTKLCHKRGKGEIESHNLCIKWDDIATVKFYQRDWTEDSLPIVNEGEIYWSGWWFQTVAERDRFLRWIND